MNNYRIKYKEESIWTNDQILTLLKLLIISEDNNLESKITKNIIEELNSSIEWDLDKICLNIEEDLLITCFDKIKSRLLLNSEYYSTNEYAHKLYPLIKPSFSKKETSKFITKLSENKGKEILKIIYKIYNLSEGKSMFDTVKVSTINELIGEWKSTDMEDIPDYSFNFNMTDLSPSYSAIRIHINNLNQINIIIPVRDYINPKMNEFNLINGICDLSKGNLIISKNEWSMKIPILKFNTKIIELHLFKTNITLERTTR